MEGSVRGGVQQLAQRSTVTMVKPKKAGNRRVSMLEYLSGAKACLRDRSNRGHLHLDHLRKRQYPRASPLGQRECGDSMEY